jgi:hypothetical protein
MLLADMTAFVAYTHTPYAQVQSYYTPNNNNILLTSL